MKSRQLYWSDSTKYGSDELNFALHFLESSCDISGFRVIFCTAEWNYGSNIVHYLSLRFWNLFHGTIINSISKLHVVTHRGNPEVFFHTIIRLWLGNKKTSSNQRGANGVTNASWHTKHQLHILGASNAGFFDIIWGLARQVLDGVQAEITTLKRRMDNKDPEKIKKNYANNENKKIEK